MNSEVSGVRLVLDVNGKPFLKCVYGHGNFICGSHVVIDHDGAFHFCTYPKSHGFTLTLQEILVIAKEQNEPTIEEALQNLTRKPRLETSRRGTARTTLEREAPEQEGELRMPNQDGPEQA